MNERDLYDQYQGFSNHELRLASYVASQAAHLIDGNTKRESINPESVPLGIVLMYKTLTKEDFGFIYNIWDQLSPPDRVKFRQLQSEGWTEEMFQKNGVCSGYTGYTLLNQGLDRLYEDLDFVKEIIHNPSSRARLFHSSSVLAHIAREIGFDSVTLLPETDPLRINILRLARKEYEKELERAESYSAEQIEELDRKRHTAAFDHRTEEFARYDKEISLLFGVAASRLRGFDLGIENYTFTLGEYLRRIS